MVDGLEDLLSGHHWDGSDWPLDRCTCGHRVISSPDEFTAHLADVLRREGWHKGEVEYSVRFDRSGYVESRHTSRESAQWSLEKLREEGVPCSLVKRLRAGEWVDA